MRWLTATQSLREPAIKTLARARRMDLPALQVNIGERQVNVAGG